MRAERLHLEFTESAFIEASDELAKNLDSLRGLGISFALDDFGTGFSSLGYLSKFPLDIVKLDQMFVRNLTSDSASQAIVQSVKTLADGLGLTVHLRRRRDGGTTVVCPVDWLPPGTGLPVRTPAIGCRYRASFRMSA